MSFTDGKPWTVTEKDLTIRWSCGKPGERFRCYICGHKFIVGDVVRWQYTNDTPGAAGNPLVCAACDGPDVIEKWKECVRIASHRFWWQRE